LNPAFSLQAGTLNCNGSVTKCNGNTLVSKNQKETVDPESLSDSELESSMHLLTSALRNSYSAAKSTIVNDENTPSENSVSTLPKANKTLILTVKKQTKKVNSFSLNSVPDQSLIFQTSFENIAKNVTSDAKPQPKTVSEIQQKNKKSIILACSENAGFEESVRPPQNISSSSYDSDYSDDSAESENESISENEGVNGLYEWNTLKNHSDKCMDTYGFTLSQIKTIYDRIAAAKPKNNRGRKPLYSDQTKFLLVLYHLKHYESFIQMRDKFGSGPTVIARSINTIVQRYARSIFKIPDVQDIATNMSYFFQVSKPKDSTIANEYYNEIKDAYGVFINIGLDKTGKAISLSLTRDSKLPSDHEFIRRLTGKFDIMNSRYRGDLIDMRNVIRFVIGLVNFDAEFKNEITSDKCISFH